MKTEKKLLNKIETNLHWKFDEGDLAVIIREIKLGFQERNAEVKQEIEELREIDEDFPNRKFKGFISFEELLQKLGLNNKEVYGDE